jgi:O-antigen ligase
MNSAGRDRAPAVVAPAAAITVPPAPWAGVLTIAAAGALLGAPGGLLVWGVACTLIAVTHWRAGVLLWVATMATVATPIYRYRNAVILLGTALLALLVVVRLARAAMGGRLVLPRSTLTVPLLGVAATAILAGLQGALLIDPNVGSAHRFVLVQIYAVGLVLLSVAAAFVVAETISSATDVATVVRIIIGIGLVFGIALEAHRAYDVFGPWSLVHLPRWYPLVLAHAIALVYARLLFGPPLGWAARVVGAALVGWVLWDTMLRPFLRGGHGQWISGWLMIAPPIAVLTLLRAPRLVLGLGLTAGAALVYAVLPNILHAFTVAQREGDFGRFYIWSDALSFASMRPLLGIGPGNYLDYAKRYARVDMIYGSAHGDYQQIAAEMGLLGLLFVVWVFVRALALAWRTFRAAPEPWHRTVAVAALAVLVGQLSAAVIGDYLLPAYHNGGHFNIAVTIYNWVLLGILMGIETSDAGPGGRRTVHGGANARARA